MFFFIPHKPILKIMKATISIFLFLLLASFCNAQENKKDTMFTDSTHMEKIKKMPMDTMHHSIPVKPVLPEEQKDKKGSQPIHAPSDKKKRK